MKHVRNVLDYLDGMNINMKKKTKVVTLSVYTNIIRVS